MSLGIRRLMSREQHLTRRIIPRALDHRDDVAEIAGQVGGG